MTETVSMGNGLGYLISVVADLGCGCDKWPWPRRWFWWSPSQIVDSSFLPVFFFEALYFSIQVSLRNLFMSWPFRGCIVMDGEGYGACSNHIYCGSYPTIHTSKSY